MNFMNSVKTIFSNDDNNNNNRKIVYLFILITSRTTYENHKFKYKKTNHVSLRQSKIFIN